MTVKGWRLYYGDGATYDSTRGSWEDAPATNVQVLSVYYEETYRIFESDGWRIYPYRDMYHTRDYFYRVAGDVYGCDQAPRVPHDASVKLGRMLDDPSWNRIYNFALQDLTF